MSRGLAFRRGRSGVAEDLANTSGRPDPDGRDLDSESGADGPPLPPIATGWEQTSSHLTAKLISVGLFTCLALGPVGAVAGVLALGHSADPLPVATGPSDDVDQEPVAGEFAQRVVLAWLTATDDHTEQLVGLVKDSQAATVAQQAFTARDVAVARIEHTHGIWSVTIAATVTDARSVTARRFFQVPVVVSGDSVSALTLPTPVSAPEVRLVESTSYRAQMDVSGPVGGTVAQFLSAYLAAAGDVGRYLTPGVRLEAIAPAPYVAVRLDELRGTNDAATAAASNSSPAPKDGQRLRVLASASASTTAQQAVTVTYALTLTARASRWEITAIDPAPEFTPSSGQAGASSGSGPAADSSSPDTTTTTP